MRRRQVAAAAPDTFTQARPISACHVTPRTQETPDAEQHAHQDLRARSKASTTHERTRQAVRAPAPPKARAGPGKPSPQRKKGPHPPPLKPTLAREAPDGALTCLTKIVRR
ncbi:hypothetical protein GCM10010149_66190 [Nonomuraea roseoviolacea subsp. roseoviolacea]